MPSNVPAYVPTQYQQYVSAASSKYGVDPAIISAVIQVESGWNINAGDDTGDGQASYGLGQLIASNASAYPQYRPGDAGGQIDMVGQMLSQNYKATGSWANAIQAYNTGIGGVGSAAGLQYSNKVWAVIGSPPTSTGSAPALSDMSGPDALSNVLGASQTSPQDTFLGRGSAITDTPAPAPRGQNSGGPIESGNAYEQQFIDDSAKDNASTPAPDTTI